MEIRRPTSSEQIEIEEMTLSHMPTATRELFRSINPGAAKLTKRIISGEVGVCFVAVKEGQIRGYILGWVKRSSLTSVRFAELNTIKVVAQFRRRGIGTELVKAFKQWAQVEADRVCVTSHYSDEAAMAFYQKLSFTPESLEFELRF
jgi:GNAT superfamily N-acetyltransferase